MIRRIAVLLSIAGCAQRSVPTPDAAPPSRAGASSAAESDSAVVTLERTPCFGSCPVYRVAITADGTVRFDGQGHVAHSGVATGRIPAMRVDSLLRELWEGGYFGFADTYVAGAPACGRYATDAPSARTSVTLEGTTKRIEHDYGCGDAPPGLGRLERRIDEVAETERWIGH
jgi:hypothetical protein